MIGLTDAVPRRPTPNAVAAFGVLTVLLAGEAIHEWASRRLTHDVAATSETIVILGFRNAGPRANAVNRWRARVALRSQDPLAHSTIIVSGGAIGGAHSEAELLAAYLRERGFDGPLILEDRARNTRENVANVIPLLEDAERILVVSEPIHALVARTYLARNRPDLAARVARARDQRWGEWSVVKPFLAAAELRVLRHATSS